MKDIKLEFDLALREIYILILRHQNDEITAQTLIYDILTIIQRINIH